MAVFIINRRPILGQIFLMKISVEFDPPHSNFLAISHSCITIPRSRLQMVRFINCSSRWFRLQGCAPGVMRQQNMRVLSVLLRVILDVRQDMRRYMYAGIAHPLPIYRNIWKTYCTGAYKMGHIIPHTLRNSFQGCCARFTSDCNAHGTSHFNNFSYFSLGLF